MDIEAVYTKALSADIWLNTGSWKTLDEARLTDSRFAAVSALKQGQLYNNNKRLNPWGGNDYWESGILRTDVILADLLVQLPGSQVVLPLNAVTALMGSPISVWMILRRKHLQKTF